MNHPSHRLSVHARLQNRDRCTLLLALLVILTLCPAPQLFAQTATAPAANRLPKIEHWYSVLIENAPSGWAQMSMVQENDHIITRQQMTITMKRGEVSVTVVQKEQFTETLDHKPVSCIAYMSLGTVMSTRMDIIFTPDGMEVTTQEGQQKRVQKLPAFTDPWMTPAQATNFAAEQIAQNKPSYSYAKLEPSVGVRLAKYESKIVGRRNVEVMGKTVPAIELQSTSNIVPGVVMTEYIGDDGVHLRASAAMLPGMRMEIVLADEKIATQQINPPELVAATLLHPDRAIANPRKLQRGVYELRIGPGQGEKDQPKDVDFKAALPEKTVQRVQWLDDKTARVTVDLNQPAPGDNDRPGPDHLAASTMINTDDPQVLQTGRDAVKNLPASATKLQIAQHLRQFVHEYIHEKQLSVGLASASETVRTREGDCTEHGVLLAALLRVNGIPSRVVTGIVYADQFIGQKAIFGYHMWTQAWIADDAGTGGRWVDVDATLGDDTVFDATHIAMAHSAMGEGQLMIDMMSMAPVIGRLSIRVIEPR